MRLVDADRSRGDSGTSRHRLPPVGRAAEAERLGTLVRRMTEGRGLAVVVEGDPGMGKSTMLDILVTRCHQLGVRVCRGKADELEQRLPFAAIGACLGVWSARQDPDLDGLAGLLRGDVGVRLAAIGAADRHFVVTEAVVDLLGRWCASGPVAVLLDDLHWADESSLLALHRLGPMLESNRLMVVVTARPLPRHGALDGLLRSLATRGAETLTLDPLEDAAVEALVGQLVGARPGPRLTDLIRGAGGNPMHVVEWITALRHDRHIAVVGDVAELTGFDDGTELGSSASLVGAVSQRLDVGSRDAREVLRVAALLGSGFDVGELSAVLGKPTIELWEILTEAVDTGVLADDGERLVFRHDLLRQALAAELPVALRAALQLQIAQALASSGALPERVAERLLAAALLDSRAVDWLVEQSRALTQRAPGLAIELINRALRFVSPGDPRGSSLRNRLAWALMYAGRPADAVIAARTAITMDQDSAEEPALRRLIALAHFQKGELPVARQAAELALASPRLTPPEEFRLRAITASCDLFLGDLDAAEGVAAAMAESSDEPSVRAQGLSLRACVLLARRQVAEALDVILHAISVAGTAGPRDHRQISPHLTRGVCLVELDRYEEADAVLDEAMRKNQKGLDALPLAWYQRVRADIRFIDGRWDEALASARTGLQLTDFLGAAQMLHGIRSLIAIHRKQSDPGDPDDLASARSASWRQLWVSGLRREIGGRPEEALTILLDTWERRVEALPGQNLHLIWPDIARLALTIGRPELAAPLLADTAMLDEQAPAASSRAVRLLVEGVVRTDPALVRSAAEAYATARRPLPEGYAWECLAILLARAGELAQSRSALDRALDQYDTLQATWDAERATAHLAYLGVRRRNRRQRPTSGWEALTETERRIAEEVAQGRSNPDIAAQLYLSPRTVQHHVSSILGKLGLTSRVELVTVAYQRDTDTDPLRAG